MIRLDADAYETILNNVYTKAPLEIGVEIAVFMLLYGKLHQYYDVADVNTMWRRYAAAYVDASDELTAVPDLVILDKAFRFTEGNGTAYGFVEVKNLAARQNGETEEMKSHRNNANHVIWTNGLIWTYYQFGSEQWSMDLTGPCEQKGRIRIDPWRFCLLLEKLDQIPWKTKRTDAII